jgi:hypothetical protein
VEEGGKEIVQAAAGGSYRQGKMKKAKGKNGCASAMRACRGFGGTAVSPSAKFGGEGSSVSSREFGFQRAAFAKAADAEYAESQDMPLIVHPFHDGIVGRRPHEARRLAKPHFQVV